MTVNGRNKRWRETRWEKRQPERLEHIKKKKGIRKMSEKVNKGMEEKKELQYVIVRGDRSGVFAGNLAGRVGNEITLHDCRCLWYWEGAASISQLAVDGTKKPGNCKFTVPVESITILDGIEIIPCTDAAEASIKAVREWKM